MGTSSLPSVGAHYEMNNQIYEVICVNDEITLCCIENRSHRYLTIQDFAEFQANKKVKLHQAAPIDLSNAVKLISSPKEQRSYLRRHAYVSACLKEFGGMLPRHRINALADEISKTIQDKKKPSFSTIHNWVRRYESSNHNPLSLLNHYPKNRQKRIPEQTDELIKFYLQEEYLTSESPSLATVYALFRGHIAADNKQRQSCGLPRIKPPSYSTFRRRLRSLDSYMVDCARYGKRAATKLNKFSKQKQLDDDLYASAEMDSQEMDLQLVDEQSNVIGRPNLVIIINRKSRKCVGWDISMGPPTAEKVVRALKMAILGIPHDELSGGKIANIFLDNGPENISKWLKDIARLLGINLCYPPPREPDRRAFVERMFETVNTRFVHWLPGTVKGSPKERGDYPAERRACLTLSKLQEKFSTWIEIYHSTFHRGIQCTPNEMWKKYKDRSLPPEQYTKEDLDQLCLSQHHRRLHNGRANLFRLFWTGPRLPEIAHKLGKKQEALVYVDPCNLAIVWVAHPDTPDEWCPAYATWPEYQDGLTLSEHKSIQESLATEEKAFNHDDAYIKLLDLYRGIKLIAEEKINNNKCPSKNGKNGKNGKNQSTKRATSSPETPSVTKITGTNFKSTKATTKEGRRQ